MIRAERTSTGYLLEKETKKGTWRFFMRDVDGKVFLEAKREKTFVSIECTSKDLQAIERFCKAIREGRSQGSLKEVWRGSVEVLLTREEVEREMEEEGAYDKITGKAFRLATKENLGVLDKEEPHYSFSFSPVPKAGARTYEVVITESSNEEV